MYLQKLGWNRRKKKKYISRFKISKNQNKKKRKEKKIEKKHKIILKISINDHNLIILSFFYKQNRIIYLELYNKNQSKFTRFKASILFSEYLYSLRRFIFATTKKYYLCHGYRVKTVIKFNINIYHKNQKKNLI